MASGSSSGRPASGSRAFDFGTDDVLCSYDDFDAQDSSAAKRSEPAKDFHDSRMGRSLPNIYSQQDEYPKEEIISAVEKCMKKYADNLMRSLEGISGRLCQLELYCYKVERSIGDLRADMVRDQGEADMKLKSLEKHIQEVHRSVQIIRDKQELVETQKELSKLQLVQKESTTTTHSQKGEDGAGSSVSEQKGHDDTPNVSNQQLALALLHQTAQPALPSTRVPEHNQPVLPQPQQPAPVSLGMPQDRYVMNQSGSFYPQQRPALPQSQQSQGFQLEPQYMQPRPQMQDPSVQAPSPAAAAAQLPQILNQMQPQQPFSPYQQQWPQPSPQVFPQQAAAPTQQTPSQVPQIMRHQPPLTYPPYPPHQATNPAPEAIPVSMPMQSPYSSIPQSGGSRSETLSIAYGAPGSTGSQSLPPHHTLLRQPQHQAGQSPYGPPPSKGSGYAGAANYTPQPNVQSYSSMYGVDGSRSGVQSQNYPPAGSYLPPSNASTMQSQQLLRNHPFGEVIEKAVSMGYPRDQVVVVVNRMMESGQPIDFNALLDMLSPRAAPGEPPRAW